MDKKHLIGLFLPIVLAGCSTLERNAVPEGLTERASFIALDDIRFFGDAEPTNARAVVKNKIDQSVAGRPEEWRAGKTIDVNFLIITGGGLDGAYGAGLLNGMSDGGNRLDFEVVTGVSTGALIAPFAFVGSDYDSVLKTVYTQTSTKDIIQKRSLLLGFTSNALADTTPLQNIIAKHITKQFLEKVAYEHSIGRRLFVGTTNIDAQRSVIWNMGKIASYGTEEALSLFHKVLLASAAIPAAFPPVRFTVEVDGEIYEELHVDGGTTNNAFFLPLRVGLAPYLKQLGLKVKPTMYVVRNSMTAPLWEPVKEKTLNIAKRSIETLIRTSTVGDLYKLYAFTDINNIGYRITSIPSSFNEKPEELFDPVYMSKLYDVGYEIGLNGVEWGTKPPGL